MDQDKESSADERAVISVRAMELVVAVLLLAVGAIVVFDSYRLGSKWGSDGPQSGYFPFYIGLLICLSGVVNFTQAWFAKPAAAKAFVTRGPFKLVLTVLLPALVYVLGVKYVGLYVASAVYIAVFMAWLGKYSWLKSIVVGLAVNVSLFLMFEVWFTVPLFKGDLDPLRFLGY
jgi:hypothetical protein